MFVDFKCDTVSHLAPSALYLLASDSTPEEVRKKFIERAKTGALITQADVRKALEEAEEETEPDEPDPALLAAVKNLLKQEGFRALFHTQTVMDALWQMLESEPDHVRLKAAQGMERMAKRLRASCEGGSERLPYNHCQTVGFTIEAKNG